MPQYTHQQLQDRLKKLPQVLQEAMFSPDIAAKMFALGKKHGLAIDKIGFTAEETGYVILGFTKPQEFTGILKARLEIDEEKARAIASEINREIFYPLREELKQTHQVEIVADEARSTKHEAREMAAVPPKPEESTTAPQSAKPLEPPKPPTPKPPLPPTPAPIDLRAKTQPEKPPLSELLPKAPAPAPMPPTPPPSMPPLPKLPESRSTKYEVRESPITQEAPKPAPPPKPEMMPGGGVFAAPLEAQNTKREARSDESQSPLKPKGIEKNPPTKYDPYREPVE